MSPQVTAKWVLLALVGIMIAICVAIAATDLTSQKIGISSESVSAGNALAPAPWTRKSPPETKKPKPREDTSDGQEAKRDPGQTEWNETMRSGPLPSSPSHVPPSQIEAEFYEWEAEEEFGEEEWEFEEEEEWETGFEEPYADD